MPTALGRKIVIVISLILSLVSFQPLVLIHVISVKKIPYEHINQDRTILSKRQLVLTIICNVTSQR